MADRIVPDREKQWIKDSPFRDPDVTPEIEIPIEQERTDGEVV